MEQSDLNAVNTDGEDVERTSFNTDDNENVSQELRNTFGEEDTVYTDN